MKTKQKILVEALKLFNEYGITNVSLRMISDALNISIGNLQYHYKKREQIVEQLYFELVDKVNICVEQSMTNDAKQLLTNTLKLNNQLAIVFFEYRFFFLEFVAIIRNYPTVKNHYRQLAIHRKAQFLNVMEKMVKHGLVEQPHNQNVFVYLYQQIETVSNFGLSSTVLKTDKLTEEVINEYSNMIGYCLYPYLKEEWKSVLS